MTRLTKDTITRAKLSRTERRLTKVIMDLSKSIIAEEEEIIKQWKLGKLVTNHCINMKKQHLATLNNILVDP
jgi:hypothetical protein